MFFILFVLYFNCFLLANWLIYQVWKENKKKENPLLTASKIRKQLEQAQQLETRFEIEIPFEVAACLLLIPKNSLEKYGFSSLVKGEKGKGVYILIADSREIALQAFRNWRDDKEDKTTSIQFKKAQYLSLYRLIQAVLAQQGRQAVKGLGGLFLKLLEEEDELLYGLSQVIEKQNFIPDEDLCKLQGKLYEIWESLPSEIQNSITQYRPENLFNC